jgi:hypothetical protein
MYNIPQLTVDVIQNGKKQFINKYIQNDTLKNSWNGYVDAQTNFLHEAIKTSTTIMTTVGKEMMETKVEKLFNPYSIDWFKAGWDAWTTQVNKKS